MVRIEGGTHLLGDPAPRPEHDTLVVPRQSLEVQPFCIATHPFPGSGAAWPSEGLSAGQMPAFEAHVGALGRRSCTVAELLRAAGGPENREQAQDPASCEPNDHTPGAIGAYAGCHTPEGVHDLGVRSHWATLGTLQDQFPRYEGWASWGRTSRTDTFYPATNWALHHHAVHESEYIDDGWRSCADIGATSPGWTAFTRSFSGRFSDVVPQPPVQPEAPQGR